MLNIIQQFPVLRKTFFQVRSEEIRVFLQKNVGISYDIKTREKSCDFSLSKINSFYLFVFIPVNNLQVENLRLASIKGILGHQLSVRTVSTIYIRYQTGIFIA